MTKPEKLPEAKDCGIRRSSFVRLPYPDGSLKQIEFVRFLTFDHVLLEAGPNLNVILGSNGSGKSSIICGICLAVGGNPKILGRSERYADYVKHNEQRGFVEVTITDSRRLNGVVCLRIVIDREKNHADHFEDGKKVSRKRVTEIAHELNIQIDNPCTFLAQDKVKGFAAQNPRELLKNTQKAGDMALFDKHSALLEIKTQEKDHLTAIQELKSTLEKVYSEIVALDPKVEAYHKQELMEGRVQLLRRKAAILEFIEKEKRIEDFVEEVAKLKEVVVKIEKKCKKYRKEVEGLTDRHRQAETLQRTSRAELQKQRQTFLELPSKESIRSEIEGSAARLKLLQKRVQDWEQNLNNLQKKHDEALARFLKAQSDLETSKAREASLSDQAEDVLMKWNELTSRQQQVQSDLDEGHRRRKVINEVEERNHALFLQRVNSLPPMGNPRDAYTYYCQNKKEFRCPIYVPMIDITVRGGDAELTMIANTLNVRDGSTFIFGCKDDELKLTQRFNKINTTVVDESMVKRFLEELASFHIPEQAKRVGILGTMLDIVKCNDIVRVFLAQGCSWTRFLRGDRRIDNNYAEVADHLKQWMPRGSIFTPQNQVFWTISKYSGEVLVEQNQLDTGRKRFLTSNLRDYEELDTQQLQRINEQEKAKRQLLGEIETERQKLMAERTAIHAKMQEFRKVKDEVNRTERILRDSEAELNMHRGPNGGKPNIEHAEEEHRRFVQRKIKESLEKASQTVQALNQRVKYKIEYEVSSIISSKSGLQLINVEGQLNGVQRQLELAKADLQKREQSTSSDKTDFELAKATLKRLVQVETVDPEKLDDAGKKRLSDLAEEFTKENIPDDSESVGQLLSDEMARIEMVRGNTVGTSQDVVRLGHLKKQQETNEKRQETLIEEYSRFKQNLEMEIDSWLEPLEALIKKISDNFTKFFRLLKWNGEVLLEMPENKLEVEKYGIAINVSFREQERLRRLDDQVQSGGERSVSTMLYILSLQELCPVPFRCVDEINQGMDPVNERKIFSLIVDTLATTGNLAKTQYFLLTPKLLRGLTYGEKVSVQIVHNNPMMPGNVMTWDHSDFISKFPPPMLEA